MLLTWRQRQFTKGEKMVKGGFWGMFVCWLSCFYVGVQYFIEYHCCLCFVCVYVCGGEGFWRYFVANFCSFSSTMECLLGVQVGFRLMFFACFVRFGTLTSSFVSQALRIFGSCLCQLQEVTFGDVVLKVFSGELPGP